MKWNWGTGIFIFIVLFMAACFAFLYYARHQVWNLVEEDYYPKELRYEERLQATRNANALVPPVAITLGTSDLEVGFPEFFRGAELKGSILVYRPSDETMDVTLPLTTDTSLVRRIPVSKLARGRVVVKVEWTTAGKGYYVEKDIFVP
jgi:hypothetical protein